MDDSLQAFSDTVAKPALAITQFNMWSFFALLYIWYRRLQKQTVSAKTKLESSTSLSLICYTCVLVLEAIYLVLVVSTKEQYGAIEVVNKFAEFSSVIILIHFVLELQPVLITVNGKVSIREQLR